MPSGARKRKALKRKQQQATNPHPPLDSAASDPSLKANGSFHGNGNGNGHSEFSDNHPSTDEEFQEDLASAATAVEMESPENGKGEVNAAGTGTKEESPAAGDVDLGFTPGEVDVSDEESPDEIGSAAAAAAAVPVVQIDSANEEVVQTCEAVAGASDAAVDAMVSESLVKVVSVVDTPVVVTSEVPTSGAAADASSEVPTADVVADASASESLVEVVSVVDTASESLVEVVSVVDTAVVVASVVAEPEPCAKEIARTVVATERVSLAPVIVHRATWWNCCGLLDVFSGSQR